VVLPERPLAGQRRRQRHGQTMGRGLEEAARHTHRFRKRSWGRGGRPGVLPRQRNVGRGRWSYCAVVGRDDWTVRGPSGGTRKEGDVPGVRAGRQAPGLGWLRQDGAAVGRDEIATWVPRWNAPARANSHDLPFRRLPPPRRTVRFLLVRVRRLG